VGLVVFIFFFKPYYFIMLSRKNVILVDRQDKPVGVAEKLAAHQQGLCHRAFSVFIFRTPDKSPSHSLEILLQKRSDQKYHCAGLWSNACCSHPVLNEPVAIAAQRRLKEEVGFSVPLMPVGFFHYRAELSNGLIEDEVDHVLIGFSEQNVFHFNREEVSDVRWVAVSDLQTELAVETDRFTPWVRQAFDLALRGITE